MAYTIPLENTLYLKLVEAIDYAITVLEKYDDLPAIEYLKEQKEIVTKRVENERFGGGDSTCTQIDALLKMLGDDDG
jgi:hypothetical protein